MLWRVLLALLALTTIAEAQPVSLGWRPPFNCSTNQVLKWDGTKWACGTDVGGITNSAGANVIMKSDGTNAVASQCTDNGTTVTCTGNVTLNGGLNAGDSTSADAHMFSGRATLTSTDGANHALQINYTPVASTTTTRAGARIVLNGTYNSTSANIESRGVWIGNTSTESGGSNAFTKYGLVVENSGTADSSVAAQFTAGGATANTAIQTVDGANYLNTASGSTGFGYSVNAALPAKLSVSGTFNVTDGASIGDDASADAHAFNGRATLTSTASSARALEVFYSGTSQTGDRHAIEATNNGTYDATATVRIAHALRGVCSATRSAGSNSVVCRGLYGSASGAQVNEALYTHDGNVTLNGNSGNTIVGGTGVLTFDSGFTLFPSTTPKMEIVTGTSTGSDYNEAVVIRHNGTDSVARTRRLGLLLKISSEASSGESAKAGGMILESTSTFANSPSLFLVTGNAKRFEVRADGSMIASSPSAAVSTVTVNASGGGTAVAVSHSSAASGNGVSVNLTGTGRTYGPNGVIATIAGSSDSTAGIINNIATNSVVSSTRSAGSFDVRNTAARFDATGGQLNTAVATINGHNYLNSTADSTAVGYAIAASIPGKLAVLGTASTMNAVSSTWTPTGGTTNGIAAVLASANGTIDATAAPRDSYALRAANTTTRSAGSNNVTNIAGGFNAAGAQVNVAVMTGTGHNYFNATSENSGFGYALGATLPAKLSVSGSIDATGNADIGNTAGDNNTLTLGRSGGAGRIRFRRGSDGAITGTVGWEGASEGNLFMVSNSSGTGELRLHSNSGFVTLYSNNTERARVETDGDVCIGATSCAQKLAVTGTFSASGAASFGGNVTIAQNLTAGDNPAADVHTVNGDTTVIEGSTTAVAATTGTVLTLRQADSTNNYLTFQHVSSEAGLRFATTSAAGDGVVSYNANSRAMGFGTANTTRQWIDSSGRVFMGDTAFTGVSNNSVVLTLTDTGTGQTASHSVTDITQSGSFNTTSSALAAIGANINVTSTRSAGGNNLTNKGLTLSASGAQTNIALETSAGDNRLNVSGGTTRFYYQNYYGGDAVNLTCGTGPSAVGNDRRGAITVGTSGGSSDCVVDFSDGWDTNAPICVATASDGTVEVKAVSTTSVTFEPSNGLDGTTIIYYHCDGWF